MSISGEIYPARELAPEQKAEGPADFFGRLVQVFQEHKKRLEDRVMALHDDAVAPEAIPQPTLLDRVFDFFGGTQAPEREYVVANISGDSTMLQPNPEYVPPPYDELQANMGNFVPTSTPAVERSSSTVLGV